MSPRASRIRLAFALVAIAFGVLLIPLLGASEAPSPADGAALVSVGQDLHIARPVDSDVEVLGGSVRIDDVVRGDVVAIGANVTLGAAGRVEGDLVVLGGSVDAKAAAHVGGRLIRPLWIGEALNRIPNGSDFLESVDRKFSLLIVAFKLSVLLVWLAVAIVVALAGGREVRTSAMEIRANPFHTFTVGLVAFTSFILTAIVFSYLVPYMLGIPLLLALAGFAIVAKVYGMIAVFHAVGTLLFGARSREQLDRRKVLKGDLAMAVLGLLVLGAVRVVPVVGGIVWMTASLMGVGAALATKFGRREPWFLVVQPNES